jgi:hypothetical protein
MQKCCCVRATRFEAPTKIGALGEVTIGTVAPPPGTRKRVIAMRARLGAVWRFAAGARPRGKRAQCPISARVPANSSQEPPFNNARIEVELQ